VLSLFFEKDHEKARLIIRDDGMHFPQEEIPTPDSIANGEERKTGGLGIQVARELINHISYSRMDGKGNQLILEKNVQRQ
jgi:anti-sigma regulatory factor (Ser/Thr protein kinase)